MDYLNYYFANSWLLFLIVLWVLPWKGVALWKAARNNQEGWFVAILVLNTLAILEILYIFIFSKKATPELAAQSPVLITDDGKITIEEFKKINLKIGKIIEAENIPNAEKLIKLKIDLGNEKRQIIAGIAKFYQPEDLKEKEIVLVANLKPRNLMGLKSDGMLLAASDDGKVVLIQPEKEVKAGSKVS